MWPYVIAGGAALVSTALGVRESRRNRDWQEKMSNTAHQREVDDLKRAGLNPMLSARGAGASTPPGSEADFSELPKAAGTALMLKQAQANIELTRAQADSASSAASYTRAQQHDLQTQAASGRYTLLSNQANLAVLDYRQRSELFDTVKKQAMAQLDLTTSSARGVKARAALDELDKARAMNAAELEEWLKGGSAGARLFLDVIRALRR